MTSDLFSPAEQQRDERLDPFEHDLVVEFQPPTAVFINDAGGVSIIQDQTGWDCGDVLITLSTKEAVQAVIAALQRKLGEM